MTEEEAIEILREEHDYAQFLSYVNQALDMSIKALEKQIPYPLKPNKCKGGAIPVCGKCGGIMDLMQGDLDYCPNCGQKIFWEEDEC